MKSGIILISKCFRVGGHSWKGIQFFQGKDAQLNICFIK